MLSEGVRPNAEGPRGLRQQPGSAGLAVAFPAAPCLPRRVVAAVVSADLHRGKGCIEGGASLLLSAKRKKASKMPTASVFPLAVLHT